MLTGAAVLAAATAVLFVYGSLKLTEQTVRERGLGCFR